MVTSADAAARRHRRAQSQRHLGFSTARSGAAEHSAPSISSRPRDRRMSTDDGSTGSGRLQIWTGADNAPPVMMPRSPRCGFLVAAGLRVSATRGARRVAGAAGHRNRRDDPVGQRRGRHRRRYYNDGRYPGFTPPDEIKWQNLTTAPALAFRIAPEQLGRDPGELRVPEQRREHGERRQAVALRRRRCAAVHQDLGGERAHVDTGHRRALRHQAAQRRRQAIGSAPTRPTSSSSSSARSASATGPVTSTSASHCSAIPASTAPTAPARTISSPTASR